ncbi:EAL domain-containing protein [bacterium]|nr:EAL domain-containing protein [bacterium]MBU1433371.1 EAL domain-containing protein [bacterium]MBU1503433.1 EAL domain-containing protein [bacterium]
MLELLKTYIQKLLLIGVTKNDSEALKLQKMSITILPLIIGPAGFIWGLIYFSLGHYQAGFIPMIHTFVSLLGLLHFYKTKNIVFIQKSQMLLTLILPFVLMWSLGGFTQGSFVMIWAFFAPIAAMMLDKSSKSFCWFYSFLALTVFSTLIDKWLILYNTNPVSQDVVEIFFLLNISAALSGVYFLIKHFINENDKNSNEKLNLKNEVLKNSTKQLFDNLSYLQSYKDNIDKNLIVTKTDKDGKITFANENFYKISGYTEEEVLGKTHNIIRHPGNKDSLYKKIWLTISSKRTWQGRMKNRAKDGSEYWIESTISPILNRDEEIVEYIAIRHDITKLIQHQDELTKMLYTDQLTGMPNRNALLKILESNEEFSLILINIDRFSHINDLYGVIFGNEVLLHFSRMLQDKTTGNFKSEIFRLNGDEFVVLLKNISQSELIEYANTLKEKISAQALIIDAEEISLNFSVGVSSEENSSLLSTANMAVKIARRESKNIVYYNNALSLNKEYENNILWIKKIKDAIKNDRIVMFYQEIVDNKNSIIKKYETLIRLVDEDGNVITPYFFLEIAKKAKLYNELTKIVIRKSFAAFENNEHEFSVNITIDDIINEDTRDFIYTYIQNNSVANRVTFEIVESENIENFETIERFINVVKSFGCKIAIDDFGTGYSNFEYLMRLQADFIKIDGSIIKEILHDKKSALITSVIVAFAKEMGIQVIGEFVENKEINDKLIQLGVNKSQGYYFHKPSATLD